jgi:hypothetical protein
MQISQICGIGKENTDENNNSYRYNRTHSNLTSKILKFKIKETVNLNKHNLIILLHE